MCLIMEKGKKLKRKIILRFFGTNINLLCKIFFKMNKVIMILLLPI